VSMSVLWEIPKDNPKQHQLRKELVQKIKQLSKLVQLWVNADGLRLKDEELAHDNKEVANGDEWRRRKR
jgi:hypothetical protein